MRGEWGAVLLKPYHLITPRPHLLDPEGLPGGREGAVRGSDNQVLPDGSN